MKHYVNRIVQTYHRLPLLLVTALFALSCSDRETLEIGTATDLFSLNEQSVSLSSKTQYYSLQINKKMEELSVKIESNAEWLKVCQDSLTEDGWFEVLLDEDEEEIERSAQLTITGTDGHSTQTAVCKIVQGEDLGYNSYNTDATKTMRVGYGYNIFDCYKNDISVKASILNQDVLSVTTDSLRLVETTSRSVLDIEKNTSRNIVELAELLTKKQEAEATNLKGSSKTVKEMARSKYGANESQYAYIRYYKTSGMRSLDLGVLDKMIDEGNDVFSTDFSKLRNEIIADPNNTAKITDMITKFGTHMVVKGELGAAIEITATFDKYMTGELDLRAEDFTNYFLKGENSLYVLTNGKVKDMTSTITIDENVHIYGGSAATKEALKNDINTNGRVSQDLLKNWLDSSSGNLDDNEIAKALVPINFRLIPIWNLFPVKCVQPIIDVVNEFANNSLNRISESQIGSDYYKLELTNDLLSFGTLTDDTQVKVLYARNTDNGTYSPVLEICNEYVPNIRGDKRIPVVYGIKDGRSFIGAGFFPGDGEGNPPAWLTFSDGTCYVKPLKGYENNEQLTTIYYLHGNIYETDYGMNCNVPKHIKTEYQYLQFSGSSIKYPIVKIGSGYWTRCDIYEDMEFGYYDWESDGEWIWCEYKEDTGPLYACYFVENEGTFLDVNTHYGWNYDTTYDANTKWFLPTSEDISNMTKYVGQNLKSLFRGQVSGYEAAFAGYYGRYDITKSGKDYGHYELRDVGTLNIIAAKNTEKTGTLFALSPNYTITDLSAVSHWTENYYPVRLYRTCYFKYSNL